LANFLIWVFDTTAENAWKSSPQAAAAGAATDATFLILAVQW